MGFEPTRAEPNGLAVHRLNHSATSSSATARISWTIDTRFSGNVSYDTAKNVWRSKSIPGGTRTHSLWIRSPARYPLRHGDPQVPMYSLTVSLTRAQIVWHIFVNSNNIPVEKVRPSHEFAYPSFLQNGVLRKFLDENIWKKNILPRRGIEPRPRRWERRILTTRPRGSWVCMRNISR